MLHRQVASHWVSLVVVGLLLGGCQSAGSAISHWSPWRQNEATGLAVAPENTTGPEALRPEQKADIKLAIGRSLEQQGRIDEAQKIYQEVVKLDPRRGDAYHRLALLHDRKGECQEAQGYYRQALERDPHNPQLHCDAGYNAYLQQRWPDAAASLRKAVALAPELARAHTNLGLLLARTGRDTEALDEFAKAGVREAEARSNLALAMTLSHRWSEAQAQYQLALTIDPQLQAARDGLQVLRTVAIQQSGSANAAPGNSSGAWGAMQAAYLAPAP